MAKVKEIGPYSAYAIAVKYGYKGTEEEWVQEQEANRKAAEAAAAAAAESAKQSAASAEQAAGAAANVDNAKNSAVEAVKNEGTDQQSAVASAGNSAVQAVKDEGAAQTSALDDAAAAHKTELDSIASHPPQPNTETGKWQVWNAETGAYQDTDALYEGGYYTASVYDDGTLTWQGSQEGMPELPSVNIKGPKGDKGDPGLGVPTPTTSDAGKVPVVNAEGTGYELGDPQVDAYSKSESDARYAPIAAAIRPTASGNPVSIADSVEWPLQGLKVYGKSTQDGTPSPESPVPIVSAGDGGSIDLTLCGANLLPSQDILDYYVNINGTSAGRISGNYSKVFQPDDGQTYYIRRKQAGTRFRVACVNELPKSDSTVVTTANVVNDTAQEISLTANAKYMIINLEDETAFDELMVSFEPNAQYEPYKSQSLTIPTPNGLPGIPVDSGGNYTDAEGQQRVCNYKDYAREVYVQRVEQFTFDGSSDELWTMGTNAATQRNYFSIPLEKAALRNSNGDNVLLCQAFKYMQYGYNAPSGNNTACFQSSNLSFICSTSLFNSVDDWRQYLIGNPMTLIYAIANPIETPISPEELAAYRTLHTYDGATVVSTAEDVAGIEVRYVADGEKYIDRKISEAITSAAATQLASYDALSDAIHEGVNEA